LIVNNNTSTVGAKGYIYSVKEIRGHEGLVKNKGGMRGDVRMFKNCCGVVYGCDKSHSQSL
jgi:hypothetical protein